MTTETVPAWKAAALAAWREVAARHAATQREHEERTRAEGVRALATALERLGITDVEPTEPTVELDGVRFTVHQHGYRWALTAAVPCPECAGFLSSDDVRTPAGLGRFLSDPAVTASGFHMHYWPEGDPRAPAPGPPPAPASAEDALVNALRAFVLDTIEGWRTSDG